MRKILLLTTLISLMFLVGCASTDTNINLSETEFKEITFDEYVKADVNDLFTQSKAFKITNIDNIEFYDKYISSCREIYVKLQDNKNNIVEIIATDFINTMHEADRANGSYIEFSERLNFIQSNAKHKKPFNAYIYEKTEYEFFQGYVKSIVLYSIESIPTEVEYKELIEKDEREEEIAREYYQKAEDYLYKLMDNKIKSSLAKGYTYHGIEEASKNNRLFSNGALEEGHAYYIESFTAEGNYRVNKILGVYIDYTRVYVNWASQKLKGDIVNNPGCSVIVAAGRDPSYTPLVLGIVDYDKGIVNYETDKAISIKLAGYSDYEKKWIWKDTNSIFERGNDERKVIIKTRLNFAYDENLIHLIDGGLCTFEDKLKDKVLSLKKDSVYVFKGRIVANNYLNTHKIFIIEDIE